jgi:hypothetical protein
VEYSLFIMLMMVETLAKVEIPPTVAPVEFTPPIFAVLVLFQSLCVSVALSSRKHWKVLYIRFFVVQTKSVGERIKRVRRSKRKRGVVAQPPCLGGATDDPQI